MESGNGDAIQERSAKMCGMVNPIKSNSKYFHTTFDTKPKVTVTNSSNTEHKI